MLRFCLQLQSAPIQYTCILLIYGYMYKNDNMFQDSLIFEVKQFENSKSLYFKLCKSSPNDAGNQNIWKTDAEGILPYTLTLFYMYKNVGSTGEIRGGLHEQLPHSNVGHKMRLESKKCEKPVTYSAPLLNKVQMKFKQRVKSLVLFSGYIWASSREKFKTCLRGLRPEVSHKPACTATEARWSPEILETASRGIMLSRQQTTKVLIRLRECAGWSVPLLFAYNTNRFSHNVVHITKITNQKMLRSFSCELAQT